MNLNKDLPIFFQRKEVLVNNICSVFLPISIIEEGSILMGYTCTDGYIKLSDLVNVDVDLFFHIFSEIMNNIIKAKDYLFFPGEYILSNETIYYKMSDETIKFSYSPLRPEIGYKKQILYVLNQLKSICNNDAVSYIERLYNQISASRINNSRINNIMSELKSEYDIISK